MAIKEKGKEITGRPESPVTTRDYMEIKILLKQGKR